MTNTPDTTDFQSKLARLELLIQQAERLPASAREQTREIIQTLLDLHATGLERLLDHVADAGEVSGAIFDACATDDVVSGLLLLHGLHPLCLEDRVRQAIESVQPLLQSHGGNVELIEVEEGVVRVRLEGSCDCASSVAMLRQAVEEALIARAPDAVAVEIEGTESAHEASDRVALPVL